MPAMHSIADRARAHARILANEHATSARSVNHVKITRAELEDVIARAIVFGHDLGHEETTAALGAQIAERCVLAKHALTCTALKRTK